MFNINRRSYILYYVLEKTELKSEQVLNQIIIGN